jgi:hypothetical protein
LHAGPSKPQTDQRSRRAEVGEEDQATGREGQHEPPPRTGGSEARYWTPSEDQCGRDNNVTKD